MYSSVGRQTSAQNPGVATLYVTTFVLVRPSVPVKVHELLSRCGGPIARSGEYYVADLGNPANTSASVSFMQLAALQAQKATITVWPIS